jgi:methyl-accepting chemotaxis protein
MDDLQILLIAFGYLVAFMAGRWTAMRSAILTNLAEAVSDGIDKFEDVTGIDVPDDLEEQIEDAVDDLAEEVLDAVEEVAEDVVEAVENAESIEDAVESVKDVIDVSLDDLEDLTVAGLKERLTELGLETKGRKAELIARIKDHVNSN